MTAKGAGGINMVIVHIAKVGPRKVLYPILVGMALERHCKYLQMLLCSYNLECQCQRSIIRLVAVAAVLECLPESAASSSVFAF